MLTLPLFLWFIDKTTLIKAREMFKGNNVANNVDMSIERAL